jgi:hypothetical protein
MFFYNILKISCKLNITIKYFLKIFFIVTVFGINSYSQDSSQAARDTASIQIKNPQKIKADTGFYIRSNDGESYLQVYGSIRLNGAYDINGLQSEQTFSTYDIATGDKKIDRRFIMTPFQSRFGFYAQVKTSVGMFKLKLETDFFGSENSFRIRHAYGMSKYFLIGQTWSIFGDQYSIPVTVDADGPNSSVNERTVQLRFQPPESKYNWAAAIESPRPDVTTPDSSQLEPVYQSFPDITSMIFIKSGWGHLRLSGVFRSISVRNFDESESILAGYGGLFSGKLNFSKLYSLFFQITAGKGISRYIKGLTGNGQDVVYDEQNKTNFLLAVYGGYICGSHEWSKRISSSATFGLLRIINKDFQPPDSFKGSFYFSLNSFYSFFRPGRVGMEYDFGERINKDGSSGTANRVSFIVIMDF